MQAVRVSWTVAAGACSAWVTSGSAGRYMSIARGGVAVSPPRTSVTSRLVRRADVARIAASAAFRSSAAGPRAALPSVGFAAVFDTEFDMDAPPSGM